MRFRIDGNPGAEKACLLLHSLCLDERQYDGVCSALGSEYRIVRPTLDGHHADGKTTFTTPNDQARQILAFLEFEGIDRLDFVAGISLGALTAFEIYKSKRISVGAYFLDGIPLFRLNAFGSAVLTAHFWTMMFLTRLFPASALRVTTKKYSAGFAAVTAQIAHIIKGRDMANLVFKGFGPDVPRPMHDGSARLVFIFGSREESLKRFRPYREEPGIELIVAMGYGHCQYLAANPEEYAGILLGKPHA